MKLLVQSVRLLMFVIAFVLLTACNNTQNEIAQPGQPTISTEHVLAEPLDPNLAGTKWRLIEVNGKPFPEDMKLTMLFTEDGVEGHTGCNAWSSSSPLTAKDGLFSLSLIRQTSDGCSHPDWEKEFMYALTDATSYTLEEDNLFLRGIDGETLLFFSPLEE